MFVIGVQVHNNSFVSGTKLLMLLNCLLSQGSSVYLLDNFLSFFSCNLLFFFDVGSASTSFFDDISCYINLLYWENCLF